jgi:hypothetical protein
MRSLPRDQEGEVECVTEADPGKPLRRRLREEQVLALKRPAKDGLRVALRGRRSSSPGAETVPAVSPTPEAARCTQLRLLADGDRGWRRLGQLLELDDLPAERDERGARHLEAANAERNADDRQA